MTDPHEHQPDHPEPRTRAALLGVALRELLLERGVYSEDDERRVIERFEAASPAQGAKIVARAWTDDAFRERLLADGAAAVAELDMDAGAPLVVVENTPDVHNVVVCTLCSCYPRALLGPQPAWYKSAAYRARVVREPRAVLAEFGTALPTGTAVRVHDSTAELRYLVLPRRPAGTDGWTPERLAELVTRDALIGVSEAENPGRSVESFTDSSG